jgi:hypothetical protein
VFQPLGKNNLEPALAINLDTAQEFHNIGGADESQAGENDDERLNKGLRLRRI